MKTRVRKEHIPRTQEVSPERRFFVYLLVYGALSNTLLLPLLWTDDIWPSFVFMFTLSLLGAIFSAYGARIILFLLDLHSGKNTKLFLEFLEETWNRKARNIHTKNILQDVVKTEALWKTMFWYILPLLCLALIFLWMSSWGIRVFEGIFLGIMFLCWGVFSKKFILNSPNYSFKSDPLGSTISISENIKHHQKFYVNSTRNHQARVFIQKQNTGTKLLYYTLFLAIGIIPATFTFAWLIDIFKIQDIYLSLWVISIPIMIVVWLFFRKKVQLKNTNTVDEKNLIFLLQETTQSMRVSKEKQYHVFTKSRI